MALSIGADINAATKTNSTRKMGMINTPNYLNASAPVSFIWADNNATWANALTYWRRKWLLTAATQIGLWTAANTTDAGGSERLTILTATSVLGRRLR